MIVKRIVIVLVILVFFLLPGTGKAQGYTSYGANQLMQFEENGKVGLSTCDGLVLIEPTCDYISPCFYDGMATFVRDGKTGYYNEEGEIVSEAIWAFGADFSEGLAAVTDNDGRIGFMDQEGTLVISNRWIECPYQRYSDGLALVMGDDKCYSYIDKSGEILFTLPFLVEGTAFENGYALTRYDTGKDFYFTLINRSGEELHSFHSDMYDVEISEGYIMWTNKNTVYYMNLSGEIILSKNDLEVRTISKGHALIKLKEKRWKCFDTNGKALFTIKRDAIIERYSGDYILAFDFDKPYMYYYDHHGALVKKLYAGGLPSCGRISYVDRDTGKYGYVDANFNMVIPPTWETAWDFIDHYARVTTADGTAFLINVDGEVVAHAE